MTEISILFSFSFFNKKNTKFEALFEKPETKTNVVFFVQKKHTQQKQQKHNKNSKNSKKNKQLNSTALQYPIITIIIIVVV